MLLELMNILGLIGVGLVLLAYLLLQTKKLAASTLTYSLMNFFGSGLILLSLFFAWNLAAAIVEGAWALISAYGAVKGLNARRYSHKHNNLT